MSTEEHFACDQCECQFRAAVDDNVAPICPKCKDSEYVRKAYILEPETSYD